MLQDMTDYAAGINAFYDAPGGPDPPAKPFDANDVIAVTAFIGSIFGNGGGAEHENSDLLARLEQRFGPQRGHAKWGDAMEANDPDAPVTTHKYFPYPTLTGGKVRGSTVSTALETRSASRSSREARQCVYQSRTRTPSGRASGAASTA